MIGELLVPVEQLAFAGGTWSYAAAAVLGFLAIWLSPCHLLGLTLAGSYLRRHARVPWQSALWLASFFAAMLATLALLAAVTLALGRLAGDAGLIGTTIAVAVLALAGLVLLDLVPVPAMPGASAAHRPAGFATALGMGAAFTLATGPCSLAFVVPLLALPAVAGAHPAAAAAGAVALFIAGHALGAAVLWIVASRVPAALGAAASTRLLRARQVAGLVLLVLSGWMLARALATN